MKKGAVSRALYRKVEIVSEGYSSSFFSDFSAIIS
jgi:hypothetical protein